MSEWIEWHGGEQPVADDVVVDVVLRRETIAKRGLRPFKAQHWRWCWDQEWNDYDIVAYRVVEEPQDLKARIAALANKEKES